MKISRTPIIFQCPNVILEAMNDLNKRQGKKRTEYILGLIRNDLNRNGYKIVNSGIKYNANWADGIETKKRRKYASRTTNFIH